jgi:signal transduction histidine kinase
MGCSESPQDTATHFAPPERAAPETVAAERAQFLANELAVTMLEAIPDLAAVLNAQRQVIAANARMLAALGIDDPAGVIGLRPGEMLSCVHADEGPGGCGTSPACAVCGAANAILNCLDKRAVDSQECRIRTTGQENGGSIDVEAQASFLTINDWELVVLALRDISSDKRRRVLERTFFHDVLNIAAGLQAISELLSYGEEDAQTHDEYMHDLSRMSEQLGDEIMAQRQLLAAEQGDLKPDMTPLSVPELLASVVELYRNHSVARGRTLSLGECPDCQIETDRTLLRRVLGNLVKNALEATADGGTVTLGATDSGDQIEFAVRNPGVMPDHVQKQVFQRSFSTKGGAGRGIGTHSVKLLTERYLGGKAGFESKEPNGTVFTVTLPKLAG